MPSPGYEREGEDARNTEKQQARTEPGQGMPSAVSHRKPIAYDRHDGGVGQRQTPVPSASILNRGHHVPLACGSKSGSGLLGISKSVL